MEIANNNVEVQTNAELNTAEAQEPEVEIEGQVVNAADVNASEARKVEFDELVNEVTAGVDPKKTKNIEWYANLPRKEQFKLADIVYDTNINHFGIFIEPAKKEGLVKLRLFKLGSKRDVYSRDWYLEFDNIELVKRANRIKRGFAENDETFYLLKSRKKVAKEE